MRLRKRPQHDDSSQENETVGRKLVLEIAKYIAIGLIGAVGATALTWINRLPSRSLTLLPAGVHLIADPELSCPQTRFIAEGVNIYLNDEIRMPACETPLDKATVRRLKDEIKRGEEAFRTDRLKFFQQALHSLQALKPDAMTNDQLSKGVL